MVGGRNKSVGYLQIVYISMNLKFLNAKETYLDLVSSNWFNVSKLCIIWNKDHILHNFSMAGSLKT